MDVVFVNIDGTAPEFHEVHAELLARWREFDQRMYHGGESASLKLHVAANWKLAVENYCESYHLPWVHPDLNSYSRLEDHYDICLPNKYSGQGSYVYEQLKDADGRSFPDFANLGEKWNTGAEYVALYPNVLLGVQRDHAFAMVLEPVSCERTVEHLELYYAAPPDSSPDMQGLLHANRQRWKTVFEEDISVVEGMQKGRHAEYFDGGRFSPAMDEPTHNFHYWVAGQIEKARSA